MSNTACAILLHKAVFLCRQAWCHILHTQQEFVSHSLIYSQQALNAGHRWQLTSTRTLEKETCGLVDFLWISFASRKPAINSFAPKQSPLCFRCRLYTSTSMHLQFAFTKLPTTMFILISFKPLYDDL